uniref:Reverse transcriptase domain-containing protein n=1 Tax=Rhodnius prolixus TaxID=13249 RepID=T1HYP6_RHOPR
MSKSGSRYGRRSNWFKIHCLLQEQASSVVQQHHHHHQQQHNQHHHQQQPCSSPNMLKKEDSLDECQRDKDYRYNSPSSPALTTSPPVLSGPPAVPPPSNLYTPYHLTSAQHSIATPPLTPALSVASVVSHLSPLQQTAPALTVLPTHPVLVSLASLPDPWPRPIASPPVREAPQDQPIDLSVRSKQEQVLDLTAKKLKTRAFCPTTNNFVKLWEKLVLPVITYGCEAWTLNARTMNKLRITVRAMERYIYAGHNKEASENDYMDVTKNGNYGDWIRESIGIYNFITAANFRYQIVARNILSFTNSDYSLARADVPQGSILGPLLCTVYTSDLPTDSAHTALHLC